MRINNDIEDYISRHTTPCDSVLDELTRKTYLSTYNPRMISGQAQGKFLEFVCNMLKPKNILEIGTFTGYSTICMTRGAMPNVHVDTVEVNDELADELERTFLRAKLNSYIALHIGDANEFLKSTTTMYDLIYIDGDKREYPSYYTNSMSRLNVGGYIIADNVLWDGKVYNSQYHDLHTQAVRQFNQMVQNDCHVENSLLAVRDGLMFVRKVY